MTTATTSRFHIVNSNCYIKGFSHTMANKSALPTITIDQVREIDEAHGAFCD
jgi:hypothetical protein